VHADSLVDWEVRGPLESINRMEPDGGSNGEHCPRFGSRNPDSPERRSGYAHPPMSTVHLARRIPRKRLCYVCRRWFRAGSKNRLQDDNRPRYTAFAGNVVYSVSAPINGLPSLIECRSSRWH